MVGSGSLNSQKLSSGVLSDKRVKPPGRSTQDAPASSGSSHASPLLLMTGSVDESEFTGGTS
eukprot:CAMPEP_0185621470 /NCGR_PEP_ID=MMETSP0436-20130131/57497_1 /TAXON_ID=626734 ORGANISM="Favella taraikaensis, Strain Fe Narragansett Bay" /NCGR_SAMPLE_ID=MMETSP0436 /ASSEMBLY_ACC=CAM_ASM_000390 /LENGTH=61 /DNA_ID=CAMNT_0028262795 /DNA_START=477 /DNA_END=658 /DNA_ORIENTATION=+